MNKMLTVGAAALCVMFAAGCTDLKPIQTQIDDLKSQVSKLVVERRAQRGVQAPGDAGPDAGADRVPSLGR